MRGHVRQRGERRWAVVVELPRGPDGRRRQKWMTVRGTKADAERALTRLLRELDLGADPAAARITVAEFLARWLQDYCALRLAPTTQAGYRVVAQRLVPLLGSRRLDRLTPTDIQAAYRHFSDQGLAASTVRQTHAVLTCALERAVQWGMLTQNPARRAAPPRADNRETPSLTAEQALALLRVAGLTEEGLPVVLALGLGLRAGEVLALCWADIDMEARTVTVRRSLVHHTGELGAPKGRRSRRIAMPEFVAIALDAHRASEETLARTLGTRLQSQALLLHKPDGLPIRPDLARLTRKLCVAAGVPPVHFHALRHTHATLLLANGAPLRAVTDRLGHAKPTITLNVYAHVLPGMHEETAQRIDRILGG